MAIIDNIVQVTISRQTAQVDIESFDIPLLLVEVTEDDVLFTDRVRTYTSLEGVSDDFGTQHPAYRMATALLSGQNKPRTFKIGGVFVGGSASETYVQALQEVLDFDNEWYALVAQSHLDSDIVELAETIQALRKIYFTSTSSGAALQQSQNVEYTATVQYDLSEVDNGDTISVTIAGETWTSEMVSDEFGPFVSNLPTPVFQGVFSINETTGILTVVAEDFSFTISSARQVIAAGFSGQVDASDISGTDPVGMDIGQRLHYRGFDRTAILFSPTADAEYPEAVWVGSNIVYTPGSITWEYKSLPSVTVTGLTDSQVALIESRGYNYYISVKGVSITRRGKMAEDEWVDTITVVDWLYARLQEAVFNRLVNSRKIPFTTAGFAIIENEIRSVLQQQVEIGGIDTYTVTSPRVLSIPQTQRNARIAGTFQFTARLAGAVSIVVIDGIVEA